MAAVQSYVSWGPARAREAFAVQLLCWWLWDFSPLLGQHPLIALLLLLFFLKISPLFIGDWQQAWGWSEALWGWRQHGVAGDGGGGPGLRRAARSCPRLPLPGGSGRLGSHLKCAVSILDEPSVHLRRFLFFFSFFRSAVFCACARLGESSASAGWGVWEGKSKPFAFWLMANQFQTTRLLPIYFTFGFDGCCPKLPLQPGSHLKFSSFRSGPCFVPVATAEAAVYFSCDTAVIFDFPISGPWDSLKSLNFQGGIKNHL